MRKALLLCIPLSCSSWAADVPPFISGLEQSVIQSWLSKNPSFRVATEIDCECAEELKAIRTVDDGIWKRNPTYQPFFIRGDFNRDKKPDFAVVFIGKDTKRALAIFNGPYKAGDSPAYLSRKINGALFFGPPRPEPHGLIVGEFSSEGTMLQPKGRTYVPALAD